MIPEHLCEKCMCFMKVEKEEEMYKLVCDCQNETKED